MRRYVSLLTAVSLAAVSPALGQQVDSAAAIQELRRQIESGEMTPELLRQRIAQAGLTLDQVRDRLRQAGYSPELLDRYLATGAVPEGIPELTTNQLESVLRRLAIPPLDPLTVGARPPLDTLAVDSLLFAEPRDAPGAARLAVFGMDIFRRVSSQFQPMLMGPVPPNYQLGPGDELVLIVTGDVEDVHTLPVTREGFVVIPNVGRVPVNGMTLDEFKSALYGFLGRAYSGIRRGPEATTFFEVSISGLRRNQIFVIGEVLRPGQYEVTSVSTALEALYQSGGPTVDGSFRNVQIRRGDEVIEVLDIYEYLVQGGAEGNVILQQGDVIFVPVRGRHVQVDGDVIRPAQYELKGEEDLRDLIQLAGGVRPEADVRRVQIDRVLPVDRREPGVSRVIVDVDVASLLDAEGADIPLDAGDRVFVFSVPDERRNTITLRGNVWSPGMYGYSSGMTLAELIDRAGGLRDEAYLGRAQILRLNPTDLSRFVVPVTLPAGDSTTLAEFDEVVVYSIAELQETRVVTIEGAVQAPGVFDYSEGMTLRDLVLMAGGVVDGAYLREAEVARLPSQPEPGRLIDVIRVPIDSSYAVGRPGPTGDGSNGGAARAQEFVLERYDRVFIRHQPGREVERSVTITGQVEFPGAYGIERKDERLGDLVQRAGGLTADAYAAGIRFFRFQHLPGRVEPERVRIDVDLAAILDGQQEKDIILAEGDSVDIPEFLPTVLVDGAVLFPTTVMFSEGAALDYYVSSAGGYARDADIGRVRVEYANGAIRTSSSFLFFRSNPEPDPGSRVFVPAKQERPLDVRSFAAILSAVATIVVIATR